MLFYPLVYSFMLLIPQHDTLVVKEHFVDSLHIGRKLHDKVEVSQVYNDEGVYVVIRFYVRARGRWSLKQRIRFPSVLSIDCEPQISDFNHDGYLDLTCISAEAARGANEVRRLYIYNKEEDRLVYVKNSEEYPNLHYNNYLHCINAWTVYGGCCTHFLQTRGNRLHEFASVEIFDMVLTVSVYDKYGKERIIRQRKFNSVDDMIEFKGYKPLVSY